MTTKPDCKLHRLFYKPLGVILKNNLPSHDQQNDSCKHSTLSE